MASRRQVREAAVQLLYARAAAPKEQGGPEFWELVNDRNGVVFDKARVKILAHFQQGRVAAATKLQATLVDCSAAILAADPTEKLARELKNMSAAEVKWAETVKNLSSLTKANLGGWRRDLNKLLLEAAGLKKQRDELLPQTASFPPQEYEALIAAAAKLDIYDERARMVHFPQNYPEQRDLDHLHRLLGEMKKLEEEVVARVDQVEAAHIQLDELIDQKAKNFDFSRLSKVDLAILRLASWEILHLPDLDNAVSINEAIELARSFSGEEAASFVNGILDQIAKD
ncbi:transcription antitermination factor NusB [Verrucomicrobiaceae bacterium 227]